MNRVDLHSMDRGSFSKGAALDSTQRIIRKLYIESGTYRTDLVIHVLWYTCNENLRKKGVDLK